jgi:predicted NAD-dependent protein-ADP-ribosyltransferase YbiA (DUF1768 family)
MSLAAMLAIAISTILLTSAVTAFFSIRSRLTHNLENRHQHLLDSAQVAYQQERFQSCMQEASQILQRPSQYGAEARELLNHCENRYAEQLLQRAKQFAADGQFEMAVHTAHQIPSSPSSGAAQNWIKHWSERMLEIATDYYDNSTNQLSVAISVASAIPEFSPVYTQAQSHIQQWQAEEQRNRDQSQAARDALQTGNLEVAQQAIEQLSDRPAWQGIKQQLVQELKRKQLEQHYHQTLQAAEQLLVQREPENAIALARQVPNSYPWGERRHQIIERAEAMQRRQGLCQVFTLGLASCQ